MKWLHFSGKRVCLIFRVKGKVGCKVTKKMIALNPAAMERHLNGKKLKGALARGVTGDEAEGETDEDEEEEGSGAERDMSADEGMHEEGQEGSWFFVEYLYSFHGIFYCKRERELSRKMVTFL